MKKTYKYNPRDHYSKSYSGGSHYNGWGTTYDYDSWDWSGYSYARATDDDSGLMIKEPEGYSTPTKAEINGRLSGMYTREKEALYSTVKELSRYFYHNMVETKDIWSKAYSVESDIDNDNLERYLTLKNILDSVEEKNIWGFSPLEKACNLIKKLHSIKPEKVFNPGDLEKHFNELKFNDGLMADPIINTLKDANDFSKKYHMEIVDKMALINAFGSKFSVEKEVTEKIVYNSDLKRNLKMTKYGQISKATIYQRMLPGFNVKFATKNLNVTVPVKIKEEKQKIIILVDYSGSMRNTFKQQWVCAIIMDRLKYVMEGECEIFFSYYVHNTHDLHFHHISTKLEALRFWRQFSTNPNGGDTYLGDMVNKINSDINKGKLCNLDVDLRGEKVEILSIADGQDSVKTKAFSYKTNAISLCQSNTELKNLCLKNKGKYVYINDYNNVKEYE